MTLLFVLRSSNLSVAPGPYTDEAPAEIEFVNDKKDFHVPMPRNFEKPVKKPIEFYDEDEELLLLMLDKFDD